MAIHATEFFFLVNGLTSSKHGVQALVRQIVTLNQKLAHPETESEYFRWGLRNTTTHFKALCGEYERMRAWYNTHTVDDMLEDRAECLRKARMLVAGEMNMGRALVVNLSVARIARLDEFLQLKSIVKALPPIGELLDQENIPDTPWSIPEGGSSGR